MRKANAVVATFLSLGLAACATPKKPEAEASPVHFKVQTQGRQTAEEPKTLQQRIDAVRGALKKRKDAAPAPGVQ